MISLKEMLNALIASGMTELYVATAVGTSQASINRIRRGGTIEPGYSIGRAIERMYEGLNTDADTGASEARQDFTINLTINFHANNWRDE